MSRFSGPQHKGALREFKTKRASESVERNKNYAIEYCRRDTELAMKIFEPNPVASLFMMLDLMRPDDISQDSGRFGTVDDNGDIHYLGGVMYEGIDF